jgi:hypothetical protein
MTTMCNQQLQRATAQGLHELRHLDMFAPVAAARLAPPGTPPSAEASLSGPFATVQIRAASALDGPTSSANGHAAASNVDRVGAGSSCEKCGSYKPDGEQRTSIDEGHVGEIANSTGALIKAVGGGVEGAHESPPPTDVVDPRAPLGCGRCLCLIKGNITHPGGALPRGTALGESRCAPGFWAGVGAAVGARVGHQHQGGTSAGVQQALMSSGSMQGYMEGDSPAYQRPVLAEGCQDEGQQGMLGHGEGVRGKGADGELREECTGDEKELGVAPEGRAERGSHEHGDVQHVNERLAIFVMLCRGALRAFLEDAKRKHLLRPQAQQVLVDVLRALQHGGSSLVEDEVMCLERQLNKLRVLDGHGELEEALSDNLEFDCMCTSSAFE